MPEIVAAVLLGQTQRINELVQARKKVADEFSRIISQCDWLTPQKIYPNSTHSYWAYPLLLDRNDLEWETFVEKFYFFQTKIICVVMSTLYQ